MGARHGPCPPALLPGEARPELGQRRGRPRAAGAGGAAAAAAGTARWGASPGRGARRRGCRSVRRRQRNWWGSLAAPATLGLQAWSPLRCGAASPPAGALAGKAGVERRATLAGPGEQAGCGGARWSSSGPARRGSCGCTGVGRGHPGVLLRGRAASGKALDSQRNLLAPSQPPSAAANAFSTQHAKGRVWPAMGLEVARPEKFLPFPCRLRGTGSRSWGA